MGKNIIDGQEFTYDDQYSHKDFTGRRLTDHYGIGQDPELAIKKLQANMQETINNYKAEQVIFNHAKLIAGITYLNTNLVG